MLFQTSLVIFVSLAAAGTVPLQERQAQNYDSPPYYPAPKGGWTSDWAASYVKAAAMVGKMTLAEKVNVTTAIGWQMVRTYPPPCALRCVVADRAARAAVWEILAPLIDSVFRVYARRMGPWECAMRT